MPISLPLSPTLGREAGSAGPSFCLIPCPLPASSQENFELNHETLYLAVKLVDHYLVEVVSMRDKLQLIGSTAILIASKFEVTPCALCWGRGGCASLVPMGNWRRPGAHSARPLP